MQTHHSFDIHSQNIAVWSAFGNTAEMKNKCNWNLVGDSTCSMTSEIVRSQNLALLKLLRDKSLQDNKEYLFQVIFKNAECVGEIQRSFQGLTNRMLEEIALGTAEALFVPRRVWLDNHLPIVEDGHGIRLQDGRVYRAFASSAIPQAEYGVNPLTLHNVEAAAMHSENDWFHIRAGSTTISYWSYLIDAARLHPGIASIFFNVPLVLTAALSVASQHDIDVFLSDALRLADVWKMQSYSVEVSMDSFRFLQILSADTESDRACLLAHALTSEMSFPKNTISLTTEMLTDVSMKKTGMTLGDTNIENKVSAKSFFLLAKLGMSWPSMTTFSTISRASYNLIQQQMRDRTIRRAKAPNLPARKVQIGVFLGVLYRILRMKSSGKKHVVDISSFVQAYIVFAHMFDPLLPGLYSRVSDFETVRINVNEALDALKECIAGRLNYRVCACGNGYFGSTSATCCPCCEKLSSASTNKFVSSPIYCVGGCARQRKS